MTMIRPETEMKDSGIQWLGNIPKEWSIIKGKYILKQLSRSVLESDNVVTCFRDGEVTLRSNRRELGFTNSLKEIGYQGVEPGDLVVHGMDGFAGAIGISDSRGKMSPIINVLESGECKKYLMYYLRGLAFVNVFLGLSTGIRERSCDLRWNKLANLEYTIPPLSEQQAIADYLDETCSKIDEIIAEAKASIDEYKELKQSVIFEAVTKGLDKNVNVYKTGNSWIPSLPVGIKLSRFGLHHDIILGKMLCPNPRNEEDTLEPYYCAANVHFDGVTGGLKTMWFNSKEKETYVVHKNDMLIVEGGAGAGGAAIMNEEPPVSTFVQNSIMIVRSHMKDNRYSCYLVQALVKNKYVDVVCNKATIPHFTKEKVSYMPYPVFNRNERNEIANYLDERCKQIDSLIAEKESLINDLEAYKKSLIYEVVTGKRRVV